MCTYYETFNNKALYDFINERRVKYNKVFLQIDDFIDVQEEIIYFTFLNAKEKIEQIASRMIEIDGGCFWCNRASTGVK